MAGEKQYFVLLNVCFGLDAHAEKLLLQKRFGIFRINLRSLFTGVCRLLVK